jgi:hypothetical protein
MAVGGRHARARQRLVHRRPGSARGAAADGLSGFVREALAIESVGQAVCAAAFLMPGALGVQEAGFIAICAVYGIPAAEALALSLVKRVPDITLGLPSVFAWHAHEARALMRRRPVRS